MHGVILAAGFGTRLWPLTQDRTKPAIPFLGKPLITYSVEYLASHRINDITINLHHQPDSVRRAVGDGSQFGVRVRYSLEEEILGTSGALDRMRSWLIDDDFVVINGKLITDIDLGAAIRAHKESGAIATLVLRENAARERFSIVGVDERSRVTGFGGFPDPGDSTSSPVPLMFTGIQVLSPRIFGYIPQDRFSHSTVDVYPQAIRAGETLLAYVSSDNWFELSTLERYLAASLAFMRKQRQSVTLGADCRVDPTSTVTDSVLWDRITIEPGASVRLAIIGDDVTIPRGAPIEKATVVRANTVDPDKIERGEIVGDNLIVPLNINTNE